MRLLNSKRHKSLKKYVFLKVQSTTKTSTIPVGASTGAQKFTTCEAESLLLLLCSAKGIVMMDWLQGLAGPLPSQCTSNPMETRPR